MCGFFGVAGIARIDEKKLRSSTELLTHRGPDACDVVSLPDEKIALGFNRLSILDLSHAADQPMWDISRRIVLVFNGEIYNFRSLRKELEEQARTSFRTTSDSEVILHAYLHWGWEQTLKRLEGMFAIGLVDLRDRKLFLARDRFGMKPLFYARHEGGIVFASEIKAILNYTEKRAVNFWGALNPILTTGLSPGGETFFEGVNELDSGQSAVFNLQTGEFKQEAFFHLTDWVCEETYAELTRLPDSELINLYGAALRDSLQAHLQSDAPLGVMFSAGLDSSVIAAAASQVSDETLNLYKFTSGILDDSSLGSDFASRFKGRLHETRLSEGDLMVEQPRMLYHFETINKPEGIVLAGLCRAARRDGVKVLLTGDASDELFGGYPQHKQFYMSSLIGHQKGLSTVFRLLRRVVPGLERVHSGSIDYLMSPLSYDLLETPLSILLHRTGRRGGWTKARESYRFVANPAVREANAFLLDEVAYRLKRFMIRADRYGMMESVELRLPFLHPAIVRLAVNTPASRRLKIGLHWKQRSMISEKHIVKQMARKLNVPDAIIHRKKVGTAFDYAPSLERVVRNWSFKNVAELFQLSSKELQDELLTPQALNGKERTQWCFIASEALIRMLVLGDKPESVADEFAQAVRSPA